MTPLPKRRTDRYLRVVRFKVVSRSACSPASAAENPLAGAIPMYRPSPNGQMPGITMRIFMIANILVVSCLAIERPDKALEAIQEPWLQLHPQVVVERDRILRAVGTQTLAEREQWLNKVGALKDEWIIERKVQLLIDKGEIQNARQLLLSVSFQKVHQTYTRTAMWLQICEKAGRTVRSDSASPWRRSSGPIWRLPGVPVVTTRAGG